MSPKTQTMAGGHISLESSAVENGKAILRSAMDYGFVGPLDIAVAHFHPELQVMASFIREARDKRAKDFADIIAYLMQTREPGEAQDLARASLAELAQGLPHRPESLERSGEIVRNYHLVYSRFLASCKIQKILEAGEDPAEALQEVMELESGRDSAAGSIPDLLSARAFDFDSHPPKPIPLLSLANMPLCTPGNLTNIQAPPKAGKSAVIESIIAAVFNGNRQGPDTLGFSAENLHGYALLHFDTEQSRFDHDQLVRRALKRSQVECPPNWFRSYSLADLSIRERRQALRFALAEAQESHAGIFAVLIDGIGDLCADPNDSAEAFDLVHELHSLAIRHDCTIATVLHENPGSEGGKTRGHLGSQLERKVETNLRLAKDANGITTIWSDRARHCYLPKNQGPCFSWDDSEKMHTSCGTAGEIKSAATREKMDDEANAVFNGTDAMSYSELTTAIMDVLNVSERTAKGRVKSWLAEGITDKNSNGKHLLKNP